MEKKNLTSLAIFAIKAILVPSGCYHTIENPVWPLGTHIYLEIDNFYYCAPNQPANEGKLRFSAQTIRTITKIRIIMLFKNFKNFAGIENWKQKFSPLDKQDTVNNFKLK